MDAVEEAAANGALAAAADGEWAAVDRVAVDEAVAADAVD